MFQENQAAHRGGGQVTVAGGGGPGGVDGGPSCVGGDPGFWDSRPGCVGFNLALWLVDLVVWVVRWSTWLWVMDWNV